MRYSDGRFIAMHGCGVPTRRHPITDAPIGTNRWGQLWYPYVAVGALAPQGMSALYVFLFHRRMRRFLSAWFGPYAMRWIILIEWWSNNGIVLWPVPG